MTTVIRRIIKVVTLVSFTLGVMFGIASVAVGQANAAPATTIGAGDPLASGMGCNVTYANATEALTAGHCGDVGATFQVDGRLIGTVIESHPPATGHSDPNNVDYAVIKLAPGVAGHNITVPTHGIAAPYVGMPICKFGQGIANQGKRCGVITAVTPVGFVSNIVTSFFDSGAPVYDNANNIVGVTSGMIDGGDAILNALGIPGHATSAATRADVIAARTGVRP